MTKGGRACILYHNFPTDRGGCNANQGKVKEVSMKLTKETIWHFTCDFCKLWWSFASSDEFQPKRKIFCPHCGKENKIEN